MHGATLKLSLVFRNEYHQSVTFPTVARALAVVIPWSLLKLTLNVSMVVMISSHSSTAEQYGLKNCLKIWLPDLFWLLKESVSVFSGA
jgi:hypothetical protein